MDKNPLKNCSSPQEQKEEQFEFVVKMAVIIKELMNGCDNLDPAVLRGSNRTQRDLAAGFQGQRQWTDFYPNGDFAEAMLNTSFDWDGAREPYILATENDVLNGLGNDVHETPYQTELRSSQMFVHTGAQRLLRKLQDMTLKA